MLDVLEQYGNPAHYPQKEKICHYKQISIHENLLIPAVKPEIEQILEVIARPFIDECNIIDTPVGKKQVIRGHIYQTIIYVADVPCQSVHAAHFDIPFCDFEELPCTSTWSHCELSNPGVVIEYLSARKIGPKEISKCVILFVWWHKKGYHPHPYPPPHPCPPPCPQPNPCPPCGPQSDDDKHSWMGCQNCKFYSMCPLGHNKQA